MDSDQQHIARLEERLQRLSQQKARLEMMALLYESLAGVEGLDATMEAILSTVLEVFGGRDIALYCLINGQWHKRSIQGERTVLDKIDDPLVAQVIASGQSRVHDADFSELKGRRAPLEFKHRIIPLTDRGKIFGAVRITGILLFDGITLPHFETFFHLVSILLAREVSGENRYRDLFDQLEEGVAVLEELRGPAGETIDYRVVEVNASMAALFRGQVQDFAGQRVSDFAGKIRGISQAEVADYLAQAERHRGFQRRLPVADRWVCSSAYRGSSGRISLLMRDVSERRLIDDELAKMQRLESLSVLSAGIAHDFNNLLQGLFGLFDLACAEAEPESKIGRLLGSAGELFERAKDLTRQLLTFAKGSAPLRVIADIEHTVRQALELASHGTAMQVSFQVQTNLWTCEVDIGQLSQVIQNLVINASQSMSTGGSLSIRLRNEPIEPDTAARLGIASGPYVCIEVQDQGHGIPAADLPHIFDPFFTTKTNGTGLGLASCYSIVQRHGGHIEARSVVGQGSVFTVRLPGVEQAAPQALLSHCEGSGLEGAKVLVMDDETSVRDLTVAMLERLGCEAVATRDGEQAIAAFVDAAAARVPFALVLLDATVRGGMGGYETFERLRRLCPKVRAIVSSGYSESVVLDDALRAGWRGVLPKPFRKDDIKKALEAALS